jgi:enamine deaminase RidA (YjgF/YER057c/UK114 family)
MRRRHSSGSPWEPRIGFSRAVRVGDRILVSGTAPVEPDGGCAATVEDQARRCWQIVDEALTSLGAGVADVVRTRTYLVDAADAGTVGAVHGKIFGEVLPASTMVVVAGLVDPRWRVEVEAEAVVELSENPPAAGQG